MAGYSPIIFADESVTTRIDGDLVKVEFTTRDADGLPVVTGTVVLTRFMATIMIANCYNKLKESNEAPSRAKVLQFKRAERALAGALPLNGA